MVAVFVDEDVEYVVVEVHVVVVVHVVIEVHVVVEEYVAVVVVLEVGVEGEVEPLDQVSSFPMRTRTLAGWRCRSESWIMTL